MRCPTCGNELNLLRKWVIEMDIYPHRFDVWLDAPVLRQRIQQDEGYQVSPVPQAALPGMRRASC